MEHINHLGAVTPAQLWWGQNCRSEERPVWHRWALCCLVSFLLRIFLSGGQKFQPSEIDDGQGGGNQTETETKWRWMRNSEQQRCFVITEFSVRYRAVCVLLCSWNPNFNCEASGHRRFSQSMKVHNDSEISAESREVMHPVWPFSDPQTGAASALYIFSWRTVVLLFVLTTWSFLDTRWTPESLQSTKPPGTHIKDTFIRTYVSSAVTFQSFMMLLFFLVISSLNVN